MNSQNLVKGLVVAMALASPMVFAQSNYPPAFEPQVLYRDADLIAKHAKNAPVTETKSAVSAGTAPKAASTVSAVSSAPVASSAAKSSAEPEGSSNMLFVLAGLAAVGGAFWFTKKSSGQAASNASTVSVAPVASGATGVSQYVESLASGGVETGVSKYIKGLPVVVLSQTGVAKYLRNLPPPEVAGPVETGVTKYLKSLPKPPVLPTDETGVTKYLKSL